MIVFTQDRFETLLETVRSRVARLFPVSGANNTISVENLRWENVGSNIYDDPDLHKKYKTTGRTLASRLVGAVKITDNKTKKVIDSSMRHPLLLVPHVTSKQSFIVSGKEVQIVNQLRLKPGAYTRYTVDNNVECFVNTAGGGYRVQLDRVTSVFHLRVGQSTYVYLYPVLKGLGITDDAMRQAWGDKVLAINKTHDRPGEMSKLYKKLRPYAETPKEEDKLREAVKSFFESKALDPNITKLTLGAPYDKIEPSALLSASKHALMLSKGESKADDTENLAFKSLHSVDDFVLEKIEQNADAAVKSMKYNVDHRPTVVETLPPSLLTKPVLSFFTTSEFSRYSDQNNPLDMIGVQSFVTVLGEGGIGSAYSITDNLRTLHPSHMYALDPVHIPESQKIGVTSHLALGATKSGNDIAITVIDARTGKTATYKLFDLEDKTVAFYDQYDHTRTPPKPKTSTVKARISGELKMVPASRVDYIFEHPSRMFGYVASAVPFVHTNSPNRVLMASHHIEQAVALADPDVPLVQAKYGKSGYEDSVGRNLVPQARSDSKVTQIKGNVITLKGSDGKTSTIKLHDHYPLNSNTFLNETPLVHVGDQVKKGQPLADSDFTRNGALAIGKTLRVAFLPYKGYNFEDGVVASESAAKKLTSVHKHEIRLDLDSTIVVGLARLLAHFPSYMSGLDRSKYGPDGLPRKGVMLNLDDIIIPAVRKITVHEEFDYTKLHKSLANQWMDISKKWDNHFPGEVMDVVKTPGFISIYCKTFEPLEVGDKVSQRHGGKSIVTLILPDNEMYRDKQGHVVDLLFNPSSVLGRANPGHLLEAAAGKIAEKTGKTYLVNNFGDTHQLDTVERDLKENGFGTDVAEPLIDPTTNKTTDDVMVGNVHFIKLRHQVSKKLSARGTSTYTHDESPARGDKENPMAIGSMELYSLLSGGATAFLRDAVTVKSNKNDDYWRAVQLGLPTPPPKTPFIVDKFVTYMKGAGINIKQDGTMLKALPMTDKEILGQSNGEIKSPGVVKANDLSPEQGGLFDRALTGGFSGNYWNHISLAEPIPNPLMDQAITTLLGTTSRPFSKTEFSGLLNGTLWLTPDGQLVAESKGNITGGAAIKKLLSKIDVKSDLRMLRAQVSGLTGPKRDLAVRRLRYLTALDKMGLTPVEAYLNQHIPVIPAKMRAIYPNPDGTLNVADPVHGYREVIMINNQIKDLKKMGVDAKNIAPLYSQLYAAARGLVGLQEPLTRGENFKGFIATIKGQQNKYGLFQNKVIKRRQDLTGRSTIIPDPKLGIDEAKIPDEMAFTIYRPFIVQRLVEMGHTPLAARDMIEKKEKLARVALEAVIKERPVLLNRAPSLHKFSILAFKPQLAAGRAIEINPLVVKGFNADFDGDAMMVHVPVSEAARNEANTKLLPSKNLFSPRDNSIVHAPSMEMILGVYLMTTPKGAAKPAATAQEVLSLYRAGKISVNQAMLVEGKTICAGQIIFNDEIPAELRPGLVSIDKKTLMPLLGRIAKEKPAIAGQVISKIKDLGNHYVTEVGWSFSLRDLHFPTDVRNTIFRDAAKDVGKMGFGPAFGKAFEKMQKAVSEQKDNRAVIGGLISGAFGKSEQITQTIAAPVAVTDHQGKTIEIPITNPFAQGLDSGSYWSIIPGSRKGLMDRTLATQDTGAFSKQLLSSTVATTITMQDCGTTDGLTMELGNPDIQDRVIASGPYKGKITDPQLLRNLKARGVTSLVVRTPLRCRAVRGICAYCFGPLENGQMPNIGYHIGALAGQTISEPATQMTMKTFHTSGAVGANAVSYHRLIQIMEMPTNVRGKAILAMKAGKIESIEPGPAGGWNVSVDGLNHFVPPELGLGVTKGQAVKAGQLLSSGGIVRPQDVLQATNDIRQVQDQMINDLNQVFVNANVRIKRKIYETAIQPFTNRAIVEDPGEGDLMFGVHAGDTLSVNVLDGMNDKLKAKGKRPILYTSTLLSLKKAPHYGDDFIGELIAERPHETLKRAPGLGATANIGPDGHPIATYAFGRYFGTKVKENTSKTAEEVIEDLDELIESADDSPDPEPAALEGMDQIMSDLEALCNDGRKGDHPGK